MSGFPFTPIISFICSFFILSILDFLADLLSTSNSLDKILFISLVGICHTSTCHILNVFSCSTEQVGSSGNDSGL